MVAHRVPRPNARSFLETLSGRIRVPNEIVVSAANPADRLLSAIRPAPGSPRALNRGRPKQGANGVPEHIHC
jgi:hypothetical protein